MRALVFAAFGSLAFSLATPAAAKLNLAPTSEWKLREYADKCRMTRRFGEDEDAVTVWIDKGGPGHYFNITAIGRPFRSPYGPRVTLSFAPGEETTRGFITSTSSKGRPVITMFGVPLVSLAAGETETDDQGAEETVSLLGEQTRDYFTGETITLASPEMLMQRYAAITSLDLSGALVEKVSLKTGSMGETVSRLLNCAAQIESKRAEAPPGAPNSGERAKDRDTANWARSIQVNYPSFLLREEAQGSVGVRVQIDPNGRAKFCEVTAISGPAGFADAACLGMIKYSWFNPATDKNGNPIWGSYSTRVTYRLN